MASIGIGAAAVCEGIHRKCEHGQSRHGGKEALPWRATGLDAQLRGHHLRGRRRPVNAAGDRQQMSFRQKKFGVAAIGHSALEQGSHGESARPRRYQITDQRGICRRKLICDGLSDRKASRTRLSQSGSTARRRKIRGFRIGLGHDFCTRFKNHSSPQKIAACRICGRSSTRNRHVPPSRSRCGNGGATATAPQRPVASVDQPG